MEQTARVRNRGLACEHSMMSGCERPEASLVGE